MEIRCVSSASSDGKNQNGSTNVSFPPHLIFQLSKQTDYKSMGQLSARLYSESFPAVTIHVTPPQHAESDYSSQWHHLNVI